MTTTVNDSSSIDIKLTNESSKEELEYDKDGFYITIGKIHVPPEHSTSTNSKVEEERKNIIAQINSTRPKNAPSITHRFFVEEHTTNNHPIPSVPKEHIVTINKIIDKLLVKGIIEPSENSHGFPITIHSDDEGNLRFSVNYKELNDFIEEEFLIPSLTIGDVICQLYNKKFFSEIMVNAYYKIPIDETDRKKTTFETHRGMYQFVGIPYGLRGTAATIWTYVSTLLEKFLGTMCFVGPNSILVYSRYVQNHKKDLTTILRTLNENGLTINLEESKFFQTKLLFMDHMIGRDGFKPDSEKISSIQLPKHPLEMKYFIKFAGIYRRFIQDYESFMTVPTGRNNSKPRSTIKCFDHLKNELMNAPKLFYPHPYRYFVLQTYIKERTVKAILHQEDEKGRQYLIEFSGRHYKPKEIHYEQLQMAIVAAIYGIEKHRKYLKDNIFCLLFNTNALNWIEAAKDNPISNQWKTLSNQFSFEMKHAS